MALDLFTTYGGTAAPVDALDYPFGEPSNSTAPGAFNGFPLEEAWLKDMYGFTQKLLVEANITPTGNPDKVSASQYFDAVMQAIITPLSFSSNDSIDMADFSSSNKLLIEIDSTGGDVTLAINDVPAGNEIQRPTIEINVVGGNECLLDATGLGSSGTELPINTNNTIRFFWGGAAYIRLLTDGIFDVIVSSQEEFNAMITRVAANQYKFNDDIKSIYFKTLSGGYKTAGGTSFLESGDLWARIETNNSLTVEFEKGAELDAVNTRFYLEVNTDDALIKNVKISDDGTAVASLERSFLLNANRVRFVSCESFNRSSTGVSFNVFRGSATSAHNDTSSYTNCVVRTHASNTGLTGFVLCQNIHMAFVDGLTTATDFIAPVGISQCDNLYECRITNISSTATTPGSVTGIGSCEIVIGCRIKDVSNNGGVVGFSSCNSILGCWVDNLNSTTGNLIGYTSCTEISGCRVITCDSTTGAITGFAGCTQMSSCLAIGLTSSSGGLIQGYDQCTYMSDCKAVTFATSGGGTGFENCNKISSCLAKTIAVTGALDARGYNNCENITSSEATNISGSGAGQGFGFDSCKFVSSSLADGMDTHGFFECAGCVANSAINNGVYGFRTCTALQSNEATGNVTAQYNNAFADWAGTQAAADTAAGGYNG